MTSLGSLYLHFFGDTKGLEQSLNDIKRKAILVAQDIEKALSGTGKNINLTPRVDHSELYELNKHLDIKQKHFKRLQNHFNRNPLKIKTDTSEAQKLSQIGYQQVSGAQKQSSREVIKVDVDTSGIEEVLSSTNRHSAISKLGGALSAPFKAIGAATNKVITGTLEGIGRPIGEDIGSGIQEGIQREAGEIVGSFRLISREIGAEVSKGIIDSLGQDAETIGAILQETLGKQVIAIESAARRRQNSQQKEIAKRQAGQQIQKEFEFVRANMPAIKERGLTLQAQREELISKQKTLQNKITQTAEQMGAKQLQERLNTLQKQRSSIIEEMAGADVSAIDAYQAQLQKISDAYQSTESAIDRINRTATNRYKQVADALAQASDDLLSRERAFGRVISPIENIDFVEAPKSEATPSRQKQIIRGASATIPELPATYRQIAQEVLKASGINTANLPKIPNLVASTEIPEGAHGQYVPAVNQVQVPPEVLSAVETGNLNAKQLETLVHELRHAIQFGFGEVSIEDIKAGTAQAQVELLKPIASELKQFRRNIEGSVKGTAPHLQQVARGLEVDAYTFAARNAPEIQSKILQSSRVTKFEESLGIGGAKAEILFKQSQLKALKKLQGIKEMIPGLDLDEESIQALEKNFTKTVESIYSLDTNLDPILEKAANVNVLPIEQINEIEKNILGQVAELSQAANRFTQDFFEQIKSAKSGQETKETPSTQPEGKSFTDILSEQYTAKGLREVAGRLNIAGMGSANKEALVRVIGIAREHNQEQVEEILDSLGDAIRKKSAAKGIERRLPKLENFSEIKQSLQATDQEIRRAMEMLASVQGQERKELLEAIVSEVEQQIAWIDELTTGFNVTGKEKQSLTAYRNLFAATKGKPNAELLNIRNAEISQLSSRRAIPSVGQSNKGALLAVGDIQEEIERIVAEINAQQQESPGSVPLPNTVEAEVVVNARNNLDRFEQVQSKINQRFRSSSEEVESTLNQLGEKSETLMSRLQRIFKAFGTGGFFAGIQEAKKHVGGFIGALLGLNALGTVLGIIREFTPAILNAGVAMESLERRFTFTSGSLAEGAKNLAFVRSEVKRLGIDIRSSMEGFAGLAASTRETSLEGAPTQQIFSGISQAATVYDLDAQQQERVFTAVQQMASKGTVSSEELRQQLGESLPGAFQVAARAIGVTTQELNKMLEQGQVISAEFLPKFAQQLTAETSGGVAGAANSSVSAITAFNNALFKTQAALGKAFLPARNVALRTFANLLNVIADNAELLAQVMRFAAIAIGVIAVKNIAALVTALGKIPGVAAAAQAAMAALGATSFSANKQRAEEMLAGVSAQVQQAKASPLEFLQGAGAGAKKAGKSVLGGGKKAILGMGSALKGLRVNALSTFGSMIAGVKGFGVAAITTGTAGVMTLVAGIKALLASLGPILLLFLAFETVIKIWDQISFATKDAGGATRDFADTAVDGLRNYRSAIKEALGETEKLSDSQKKLGFFGGLKRNLLDKPRMLIAKRFEQVGLGGIGRVFNVRGETTRKDTLKAMEESIGTGRELIAETTSIQTSRIVKDLKDIDDQLATIAVKRRASASLDPGNKAALRALDAEQEKLLERRERLSRPTGILSQQLQAQVEGYKAQLEELDALNEKWRNNELGGIDNKEYARRTAEVRAELEKTQKAQEDFTRRIGEAVTAFGLLQKNIKAVADNLADAGDKLAIASNQAKSSLYRQQASGQLTSGEARFGTAAIDQREQTARVQQLQKAIQEQRGLLATKEAEATLSAYGVDETTGRARLSTLAESATSEKDKFYLGSFANIKQQEVELSQLTAQLDQARADTANQIRELNKQVADYYQTIDRQAQEIEVVAAASELAIANQQQANRLRAGLLGIKDNIVSQFVDNILGATGQMAEAAQSVMQVQVDVLQNQFQLQDTLRQGEELRKQMPGKFTAELSGGYGGSDIPEIPVKLDLSSIPRDANIQKVNTQVQKATASTRDLNTATVGYRKALSRAGGELGKNVSVTKQLGQALGGTTTDAVGKLGNEIKYNTKELGENVEKARDLDQQIIGNTLSSQKLTGGFEENATALDDNVGLSEDWVDVIGSALDPLADVHEAFITICDEIEKATDKTWAWIEGLSQNVPFLQSISGIVGGWSPGTGAPGVGTAAGTGVAGASGAFGSGLYTGPSANIGGSSAYHIDHKIAKSVGEDMAIQLFDEMARYYAAQGRRIEFSNRAVAGQVWDVNASAEEKRALLRRVDAAHSHSPNPTYWDADYYIPQQGEDRWGQSTRGAEIALPSVAGGRIDYGSGGRYGNYAVIKDEQGRVVMKAGHGDDRRALPQSRSFAAAPARPTVRAVAPTTGIGRVPRGGGVGRAERVQSDAAGAQALVAAAQRLGLNPAEFAALMSWESAGTFNPNVTGGDRGVYKGLIQFSPDNQRRYGTGAQQSIAQQIPAIEQYLKDRGFKPGQHDIRHAYSAILAGNADERYWNARDSNNTNVRNAAPKFRQGAHRDRAEQFLRDSGINLGALGTSTPVATTGITALPTAPAIAPVAFGSAAGRGRRSPIRQSIAPGTNRVTQAQTQARANAEVQTAQALSEAGIQVNSGVIDALQGGYTALNELRTQLRESGVQIRQSEREVQNLLEEYSGPLTTDQQEGQRIRQLESSFESTLNDLRAQREDRAARHDAAQRALEITDFTEASSRESFQRILESGLLDADVSKQAQEALQEGVFSTQVQELLNQSLTQSQMEITSLDEGIAKLEAGKLAALEQVRTEMERTRALRRQNADFSVEEKALAELEAQIAYIRQLQQTDPSNALAAQLPAMEAELENRRNVLEVEKERAAVLERLYNKEIDLTDAQQELEFLDSQLAKTKELVDLQEQQAERERRRAAEDRALAISGQLTSSRTALLDAQAAGLSQRGMSFEARKLQKQSALLQHEQSFQQQRVDLERFIETQGLAGAQAQELRNNLEALNQVQFNNLQAEFDPWAGQLSNMQGAFKGFFSDILTGSKSIGDAFKGMVDKIIGGLADMAAEWLTNKLFGDLFGMNKPGASPGQFMAGSLSNASTNPVPITSQGAANNIIPFLGGGAGSFASGVALGTSPMTPMYVTDVSGAPFGDILGGDLFGKDNGILGGMARGSFFGGTTLKPLPVNMIGAATNVFDPITDGFSGVLNGLGGLFGGGSGGSGIWNIAQSVLGGFGGGGNGGGLLGGIFSLLGGLFAHGGIAGIDGEQFHLFARGGLAEAIQKEKRLNGGRPVVPAVLTQGERVLSLEQNRRFEQLGGMRILNYAAGGSVGGSMAGNMAKKMSPTININAPISANVQGSDNGNRADDEKLNQILTGKFQELVAQESRPGGSIWQRFNARR